jgi:hypothetical protein
LRGPLAHKVDAAVAGLSDMITVPAGQLGLDIQQIRADDLAG